MDDHDWIVISGESPVNEGVCIGCGDVSQHALDPMILCGRVSTKTGVDKCNNGMHITCAGLSMFPVEGWSCPPCSDTMFGVGFEEDGEGEEENAEICAYMQRNGVPFAEVASNMNTEIAVLLHKTTNSSSTENIWRTWAHVTSGANKEGSLRTWAQVAAGTHMHHTDPLLVPVKGQ
jgi:hypothetical protein